MTSDFVYLRHILDSISKIETYVAVGKERFVAESQWHDAAIRQLEIIGEATKKLSPELRSAYPGVELAACATCLFTIIWGSTSMLCGRSLRRISGS